MRPPPLRPVLWFDAVATAAVGLAAVAGAGALAAPLGLPPGLLSGAGAILLPWAAFVLWVGLRPAPARGLVWCVAGVNLAWVAASVLALLATAPTTPGVVVVLAQGIAVAVLAELQIWALGRDRPVLV